MTEAKRDFYGVTVDVVARYRERDGGRTVTDEIAVVDRLNAPLGLALIGGYIEGREEVPDAAAREAREEIGVDIDPSDLTPVYGQWNDPYRNLDRIRTFTWAYTIEFAERPVLKAGDDAKRALWVPVASILDGTTRLVFPDHPQIITAALAVLDK